IKAQQSPQIVRFWCDEGACWGIPFHQVLGTHYNPKYESLLIKFALGTIVVMGPKARDFYDRFPNHKATLLKADGKDILWVTERPKARCSRTSSRLCSKYRKD